MWCTKPSGRTASALAVAAVLSGGCAGARLASGPAGAPPDLTVDLVILRGRDLPHRAAAHARPARFLLRADGSLHYAAADRKDRDPRPGLLPPRVRTLDRGQVKDLWSLLVELGFAGSAVEAPVVNENLVAVAKGETTYVVSVGAAGSYQSYVLRWSGEPDLSSGGVRLARRLAELAWVGDLPEPRFATMPPRFDFGPDPYARYRRP